MIMSSQITLTNRHFLYWDSLLVGEEPLRGIKLQD